LLLAWYCCADCYELGGLDNFQRFQIFKYPFGRAVEGKAVRFWASKIRTIRWVNSCLNSGMLLFI